MADLVKEIFEFSDFRVDVSEHLLLRNGERIALPSKAFDLLCFLLRQNGSLVRKDVLMSAIWNDTIVEENSLDKNISFLRTALGERSSTRKYIETVRGHGYRFVGPVDRADTEDNIKSIAVLPFADFSADGDNDYFCDGLSEELLNALANVRGLKVAARTSAFFFKNRNIDVIEIGAALNVENVLEGSVRKDGDRLRITAQLINAVDGFHLWSESFDGVLANIFDLQERITLSVINKLKVNFAGSERAVIPRRYEEDVGAYQMYLKGRYHILKLRPDELLAGIPYFYKAIALDNTYAIAYVGLAQAYMALPLAGELPPAEFAPKAKAAALKALELDDRLADAHSVLGWLYFWYDRNWKASQEACLRAIELNTREPEAYSAYAHLLSNNGQHSEALQFSSKAVELDPLNLRINALAGQFLFHAGHIEEALAQLKQTSDLEPTFWLAHLFTASVLIEKEEFAEALLEAQKAREFSGGSSHAAALVVFALARAGRRSEAGAILNEMTELALVRHVPKFHFALAYVGLGRMEEGLGYLEQAFEESDPKMAFLRVDPKLRDLYKTPRFKKLLQKMNFL